jgi:hypothetical protein
LDENAARVWKLNSQNSCDAGLSSSMKKILVVAIAVIAGFALAQATAKLELFKPAPLPQTIMPDPIPNGMTGLPLGFIPMSEDPSTCTTPSLDGLQVPIDVRGVRADSAVSRKIQDIVDADQDVRQTADFSKNWDKVAREDAQRRTELLTLIPKAVSADDFANIALVFQHGDCIGHYMLANHFARLGASGSELARWLVAATLDRALMSLGRAQKYGTQYTVIGATQCYALYVVDPRTTDEERMKFNVPSFTQALAQAKEFNAANCK